MSEDFSALAGFRAGSTLAGYRLEAQVGAGGFAVVFRARDERLSRLVALKILAPGLAADAAFRRRFIAESRAAAAVDDPHIIPVYEAGEANGVLFIAMRFVPGGDLRRVLEREGALAPGRAAEFFSPVASALDAAHRAGLVHRDVKPANILVDAREDRPDHVYLSDFGVSKGTASLSLTASGQFLGTPDYSPPEQIDGRVMDGRTDQYALACVAYQMLAGEVPFERDQGMAVLLAHMSAPPPSLSSRRPDLPAAADQVLARGMAKVPEERYGSCREFADALREALGLASRHLRGPIAAPGHPHTQMAAPPPEFSEPATAPTAVVPAEPAAAASVSPTASMVSPVMATPPSPAYPPPGQAGAVAAAGPAAPPGDAQHTTPPPPGGHPQAAASGPGPGLGEQAPRAPRSRLRRRPAIIAAALAIPVIVVLAALGILSGSPHGTGTPPAAGTSTKTGSLAATGSLVATGSPAVAAPPRATVRWVYSTGAAVDSRPAVADGTVYVSNEAGKVYALNAATGGLDWAHATGTPVNLGLPVDSSPVMSGGTVYIGSGHGSPYGPGTVYALNAATGSIRWTHATGRTVASSPAVAGGIVYIGSNDWRVYALDAATGGLRWTYATGNYVSSSPAVAGGTVYIGSDDGKVYALNAVTGGLRWAHATGNSINSSAAVAGGTVYIASIDHNVYALDAVTGTLRWSYSAGDSINSSPVVAGGVVYIGGNDGMVYALNAASGSLLWTHATGGPIFSSPAVAGGTVYIGSEDGKVYALNAATGNVRWSYRTGGQVDSSPVVAGGTVYIGNAEGKVYALAAAGS